MGRPYFSLLAALSLASCGLPGTVDRLQESSPPPEFGRPAWVRTCAGFGAWVGGVAGGLVSVVALPITYPISLAAGDSLGGEMSRQEFLLLPMTFGAATGHFLLGAPPDAVDFLGRRVWVGVEDETNTYELKPMDPPAPPAVAPAKVVAPAPESAAKPAAGTEAKK